MGLALAMAAVVVGPPALLRGPVLVWAARRTLPPVCGSWSLDGGRVGWSAVPAVVFGWTVPFVLENLQLRAPDGERVVGFRRLEGHAAVSIRARHVRLTSIDVTEGLFRLAETTDGQTSSLVRAVAAPPRCGASSPAPVPHPRRRNAVAASAWELTVEDVHLTRSRFVFSFSQWGLALDDVTADARLAFAARRGFAFDVRDAHAGAASQLRVGPSGRSLTAVVPFDDVHIARVASVPFADNARPADLRVEVAAARTGRAALAGTATFGGLFSWLPGRRAGLQLDARWESLGDALARTPGLWAGLAPQFAPDGGSFTAQLHGPYGDLRGDVAVVSAHAQVRARLGEDQTAEVEARFAGFATSPFLHPALRGVFGGDLTGQARVSARLGELSRARARVDSLALELVRAAEGPSTSLLPARLALRLGPPTATSRDTLTLSAAELALTDGRVTGQNIRLTGPAVQARADLTVELLAADGSRRPTAAIGLDLDTEVSVAALLPSSRSAGRLELRGQARGAVDALDVDAVLRSRALVLAGQSLSFGAARLRVQAATAPDGRQRLVLAPFVLHDAAHGARLAAHGTLDLPERLLHGRLDLHALPLGVLPGLARVRLPALAGRPSQTLAEGLVGWLDARLDVDGPLAQPNGSGEVRLRDLSLAGQALGSGVVQVRAQGTRLHVAGQLFPGAGLTGSWELRHSVGDVRLTLDEMPLSPWLPEPFAHQPWRMRGDARLTVADAGAQTALSLQVSGPDDAALNVTARSEPRLPAWRAQAQGTMGLRPLQALLPKPLQRAQGHVQVTLDAEALDAAAGQHPVIRGHATWSEPLQVALVVSPRRPALPLELAPGDARLDGVQVRTDGLTLTTPGAVLHVDGSFGYRDRPRVLDVHARAAVTAKGLARWLPAGLTADAGEVRGSLHVRGPELTPEVDAALEMDNLRLSGPGLPLAPLLVTGHVITHDRIARTSDLRVQLAAGASGALRLGRADAPAVLTWDERRPLGLASVDAPLSATGLTTARPLGGISVRGATADLHWSGNPESGFDLRGAINLGRITLPGRDRGPPVPKPDGKRARTERNPAIDTLIERTRLDVLVTGQGGAVTKPLPLVPDVKVDLSCRLRGSLRHRTLNGTVAGHGLYSRALVTVYDWFSPHAIRDCELP